MLSHVYFGVCEAWSRNVSRGQRVTHYQGKHDKRDNRKICIAVDNQGARLLLRISLTDRGWELATPNPKHKAAEAHPLEQLRQQLYPGGRVWTRTMPGSSREGFCSCPTQQ